ncbi:MAG: hypothetical protein IT321_00670 [Anaerolineae bacterium]|nr:hypothetical protein [Anaerolineae bacterium]
MNAEWHVVTPEYIQQALDALTWVTQDYEFNPLESLQIVDDLIVKEGLTFINSPRRFALNEILTSTVETLYRNHRQALGLVDAFTDVVNVASATSFIVEDASTEVAKLIGFSWIYFHYVKNLMGLSQQQFSILTNINSRTIRRYQKIVVEQLADHIAKLELIARKNKRVSRLGAKLPHKGNRVEIWGRERELQTIKESSRHFHIIGLSGIGKTALVEYAINNTIDNDTVDQIVWLDSPASAEFVKDSIYEQFVMESVPVSLENLMLLQRFIIVLDNCELLFEDAPALNKLLSEFSNAQVFLTTGLFVTPILECKQIFLKELDLRALERLVLEESVGGEQTHDLPSQVQKLIGGNPAAVKLFLKYQELYNLETSQKFVMEHLFNDLFSQLTNAMRLAWLLVSLCQDYRLNLLFLADLNLSQLHFEDFAALVQRHIIVDISGTLSMSRMSRLFIQSQYQNQPQLQDEFTNFMTEIDKLLIYSEHVSLIISEAVLSTEWIVLGDDLKKYVVDLLWQFGIQHGRYAQWYAILNNLAGDFSQANNSLLLGYSICSRYLGRFEQSQQLLKSIVEHTGLGGQFDLQAKALLELCVLLRHQANYNEISNILKRLKTLLPIVDSHELTERLLIEETEYAIDIGQWDLAQENLARLPVEVPRKIFMQLEVLANFEAERLSETSLEFIIQDLIERSYDSTAWIAQAHVLIARILEKQGNIKVAVGHFSAALSILEQQDNDPFSLARTQSNLAAALLMLDQISGVSELIDAALHTQRIIGDHRGFAVTMHNNRVLARKIVS